ncbi:gamma-irradiation and mitomycin c induced 1, partial [Corchorus olitorius]
PFFGMFGYGGPIASMHIGSGAIVSSKTKESKNVYTLRLSRPELLSTSNPERSPWRTDGSIRDLLKDESEKSPHGSFTKVEILEPKRKDLDIRELQCKLKDIYFPYIQCDELSKVGRTITPVEFQVNGVHLTEIEGGEVAITNLHSCNGPEFIILLHFKKDKAADKSSGSKAYQEANARLKCVYFPIREGKENIERILKSLDDEGWAINENFENFSRVSIRRLGRLLPDARYGLLPFMDLRQRKGDKSQLLKRCCLRVKCFVETDAGFNPSPSKTDLALYNPFSIALKNFGGRHEDKGVDVEIYRDGKKISFPQVERDYRDWLLQMHDRYDEEMMSGEDQPVLVIDPSNKKALGISDDCDVIRVYQILKRKGVTWKSGQKIKVLKGACAGLYKKDVYATIEHFLIEGLQGDFGGEARIICRPIGAANGCILSIEGDNASLDIQESLSLPVSVIDSEKCTAIADTVWNCQLQKVPSRIDLLNAKECRELQLNGALPTAVTVQAGLCPPKVIVAALRPSSFDSSSPSNNLDQKDIVKTNLVMSMEVNFKRTEDHQAVKQICLHKVTPSSHRGFYGLYIFQLGSKFPKLFQEAGKYTFSFSVERSGCQKCMKTLKVVPSNEVGEWQLLRDKEIQSYQVRVGSCFPPLSIACYDIYNNQMPFSSIPDFKIKINEGLLVDLAKIKPSISSDNLVLSIEDVMIETCELDSMRPHYAATLMICSKDEEVSVSVKCQVTPGALHHVKASPEVLENLLLPGLVIQQFVLEMFDAYENHVAEGLEVQFHLDGFCIDGQVGSKYKVDDNGCIDLGGLLKVTASYGKPVSLSVSHEDKVVFHQEFKTEKRELRIASRVPEQCIAGSKLENLVFEVVDSNGVVDKTFHDDEKCGLSHTLKVSSKSFKVDDSICYAFRNGCCIITSFPLPQTEGPLCFMAFHSRYKELYVNVKLFLAPAPTIEPGAIEYSTLDGKGLFQQSLQSVKDAANLLPLVRCESKELEVEVCKYAQRIGFWEDCLKELNCQKSSIQHKMLKLQASLEPNVINNLDSLSTKEEMMELIEDRDHSAASVLCSLAHERLFQEPWIHVKEDIVGVVALLGTVCTSKLSRILAEYLGEDQMLAIVCKSYAAACALEKYEHNGEVDCEFGLHAEAAALGKSLSGRFLVVCLEDIRPFPGQTELRDPQRRLYMPDPKLPNRSTPQGFLGYAVNMVNLEHNYLENFTAFGHGLRETLFYSLFSELQVYETRKHMENARACIKDGAVSLDGGILRKNGVISLGYRNPDIYFPVEVHVPEESKESFKQIKEMQLELRSISDKISVVTRSHEKAFKKYDKKKREMLKSVNRLDLAINDFQMGMGFAPNTPYTSLEGPPM